ncbi:MAG TPA: UDP-N-acetylmuramate--L-alanine ligase [Acidimicrobiia bacterium]
MADLVGYERIHLIGAGGAGMSGLAKLLAQCGHRVSGSDLKPGPALFGLEAVGIEVWVGHRPERAGEWDLVVASSAVPGRDPEIVAARGMGVDVWERPRLLEVITRRLPTIGVTGTHGKTTGTAMLVTALRAVGRNPSFMVGGELVDLNTNAHLGEEGLFVLEADEAFGTFLDLSLRGLVITNVETDHLDHYKTLEALADAFVTVARGVDGPVVACLDDEGSARVAAAVGDTVGYGTSERAAWRIEGISHASGSVSFTLRGSSVVVPVKIPKPGAHVARNAAGVLSLLGELGFDVAAAARGLAGFGGVRRRFDVRGRVGGITIVDDYAHHPTEVRATIEAASVGHAGRIVAVFQPHRFTRTAEHGIALGRALAGAARVFVTDVYGAGEVPIPGVTGRVVADAAGAAGAEVGYVPRRVDLARVVAAEARPGDLVLLMGAGDVTLVADELSPLLARG